VLFVSATGYFAGAEVMLLELLTRLDRQDWQPLVVLPFLGPLSAALDDAGIPWRVWSLAAPRTRQALASPATVARLGGQLPFSAVALARWLRSQDVSLVHTNSSAVLDGALAARLARVPHVWHVRERLPLGGRASAAWGRLVVGLADRVICISRAVQAQTDVWRAHPRVVIVPDGFDLQALVPGRSASEVRAALGVGDAPLVGMVGRISPIKGHQVFLDAAAQLAEAWPEVRFVIVGGALPAYAPLHAALQAQASAGPLAGRVLFTGELPRAGVIELMPALDVLVMPTVTMEGFGLVALEAMASGVPVVATHGGPDDFITNGVTGRLIAAGRVDDLAAAVSGLLADPAAARQLGQAGQKHVQQTLTLAAHVARVVGVYDAVLRQH
jgi:glycosyltransferase involved in cell wall biosynthesis